MNWFLELHPVAQGLLATLFTYSITVLGAAVVFVFRSVQQKALDFMMGASAGVMIAASYWSLLEPAITLAGEIGQNAASITALGFTLGSLFIMGSDFFLGKILAGERMSEPGTTGKETGRKRCLLLVTAVTMHNIPEGLAVGVAFGSAGTSADISSLYGAIMLAVGIGIQNFPEGTCVAMPLRREGMSRKKSFLIGQFSGIVEPVAGVIGALFALHVQQALPQALAFSAGAMISVVCSELIPESFHDNKQLATLGVLVGFIVMMVLDVTLG